VILPDRNVHFPKRPGSSLPGSFSATHRGSHHRRLFSGAPGSIRGPVSPEVRTLTWLAVVYPNRTDPTMLDDPTVYTRRQTQTPFPSPPFGGEDGSKKGWRQHLLRMPTPRIRDFSVHVRAAGHFGVAGPAKPYSGSYIVVSINQRSRSLGIASRALTDSSSGSG